MKALIYARLGQALGLAIRGLTIAVALWLLAFAVSRAEADTKVNWRIELTLDPLIARTIYAIRHRTPGNCGYLVGFRYHGAPGQIVTYAHEEYVVPESGWLELIATRRDRRRASETVDQFGFADREVPMEKVRVRR